MVAKVTKLRIESFAHPDYTTAPIGSYTLMFNPETVERQWDYTYSVATSANQSRTALQFTGEQIGDFRLAFLIDGTGVGIAAAGRRGKPVDVQKELTMFFTVTRSPVEYEFAGGKYTCLPFCRIAWGEQDVFRGVIKHCHTTTQLFAPDGSPLRVAVDATFSADPTAEPLKKKKA